MTFSSLIGNDLAKSFLEKVSLDPKGPQVFLFSGSEGVGKKSFALHFAQSLLGDKHKNKIWAGIHPDILCFEPEGKMYMHPISSIRKILEEAALPPFEAPFKIYIVQDVERMLPSSSNALLKTLEEPHPHLRFILLTSHSEEILPTIASRCCKVPFYPIEESLITEYLREKKEIPSDQAAQIAIASQGSLAKAIHLAGSLEDPIRISFLELLKQHFLSPSSFLFIQRLSALEKLLDKKVGADEESSAMLQIMDPLLESLLFWLRDLHLLKLVPSSTLFHAAHLEDLQRQASLERLPSLEKASLYVEEARTCLQRSMKPKVILENLFSKIAKG